MVRNLLMPACAACHSGNFIAVYHDTTSTIGQLAFALDATDIVVDEVGQVTITFRATDANTGEPILDLDTNVAAYGFVGPVLAYPVPEYTNQIHDIWFAYGGPTSNGGGSYTFTFPPGKEIPVGTTDTFAIGFQARTAMDPDGVPSSGDEYSQGSQQFTPVTFRTDGSDDLAVRRTVVDESACAVCHDEVRMHGTTRAGVDFCVMCHNPNLADSDFRSGADDDHLIENAVTLDFKNMIHRIHTGEDLDSPYDIVGFYGGLHDFTHTRFSGRREQCSICHGDNDISLPLADEVLSSRVAVDDDYDPATPDVVLSDVPPQTSACNRLS